MGIVCGTNSHPFGSAARTALHADGAASHCQLGSNRRLQPLASTPRSSNRGRCFQHGSFQHKRKQPHTRSTENARIALFADVLFQDVSFAISVSREEIPWLVYHLFGTSARQPFRLLPELQREALSGYFVSCIFLALLHLVQTSGLHRCPKRSKKNLWPVFMSIVLVLGTCIIEPVR